MDWIKRAWRGEEKLWKVFWVYGFLLGFVVSFILEIIKDSFGSPGAIIYYVALFIFYVWLMISQWRCAFNANWRFWGYAVRSLIVLSVILFVSGIFIGGGLVGQDLIKAAECRKELKEYQQQGGTDIESFKKQCLEKQLREREAKSSGAALTAPPPVVVEAITEEERAYVDVCKKAMTVVAQKGSADPVQYIAENQAYLKQCVKYHAARAE